MTDILLIIEGEKGEKKFFESIQRLTFGDKTQFHFYIYKTNIYQLYSALKFYDFDADIEDILKYDNKNSVDEKECLNRKFAYKYLVFDLDYQESWNINKEDSIKQMIEYFSDETENGKLLINYPMLESFRDMDKIGSEDFQNTTIEISELPIYSVIVSKRGNTYDINRYNWNNFLDLCSVNIKKANKLINNSFQLGTYNIYESNLTQMNILTEQFKLINQKEYMYVLNCGIFFLLEYFGNKLFNKLKD